MLAMHILLPKQSNFKKKFEQFENLGFLIMSTRENIRLIARAPLLLMQTNFEMHIERAASSFSTAFYRLRENCKVMDMRFQSPLVYISFQPGNLR